MRKIIRNIAALWFSIAIVIGLSSHINSLSTTDIQSIKGQERYETAGMIADRFGSLWNCNTSKLR